MRNNIPLALPALQLLQRVFNQMVLVVKPPENFLSDSVDKTDIDLTTANKTIDLYFNSHLLGLFLRGRSSKIVKLNFKPFVNVFMNFEVLIADLLWREAFFQCLAIKQKEVLIL